MIEGDRGRGFVERFADLIVDQARGRRPAPDGSGAGYALDRVVV